MSKFNYDILKEAKGMSMEVFEFDSKEEADEYEIKYRSCKNDSLFEKEEKPEAGAIGTEWKQNS